MHTVPPKSEAALQRHVILLSSTNPDPRLLGGEGRQMYAEAREPTSLGGSLDAATEPIDVIAHDLHALTAARGVFGGRHARLEDQTGELRGIDALGRIG
jgi:hypothetical protein